MCEGPLLDKQQVRVARLIILVFQSEFEMMKHLLAFDFLTLFHSSCAPCTFRTHSSVVVSGLHVEPRQLKAHSPRKPILLHSSRVDLLVIV